MKVQFDPTFFKIKEKQNDSLPIDPAEEALKAAEDRDINHFASLMGALLAGPLVKTAPEAGKNWYKDVLKNAPEENTKQFYLDPAVGETKKLDQRDLPTPKEAPLKLTGADAENQKPQAETATVAKDDIKNQQKTSEASDGKKNAENAPPLNQASANETKVATKETAVKGKDFLAKLAAEAKNENPTGKIESEAQKEISSEKAEVLAKKATVKQGPATQSTNIESKVAADTEFKTLEGNPKDKESAGQKTTELLNKAAGAKPSANSQENLRTSLAREGDAPRNQNEVNTGQNAAKGQSSTEAKTIESLMGGGSSQTGSGKGEQNPGRNSKQFQFAQGAEKNSAGRRGASAQPAVRRGQSSPLFQKNFNELIKQTKIAIQSHNRGNISIRLNPEYMGEVHLKFDVQDGQLRGLIRVETAEARALFQQNLSDLFKQFESSGLKVDDLQIEYEGEQKENAHQLPEHDEEDPSPKSDRDWGDAGGLEHEASDDMTRNDYNTGTINIQA